LKKLITLTAVALLTATPALAAVPDSDSAAGGLLFLWLTGVGLCFYFLPAIIGFGRKHQHRVPILLLNLFFGWTFIGWVAALIWSAMPVTGQPPRLPREYA
jgi:hypothetical protein